MYGANMKTSKLYFEELSSEVAAIKEKLVNEPYKVMYESWYIHSFCCLPTGPQPLPKRVFQKVRSSASSFSTQYHSFT